MHFLMKELLTSLCHILSSEFGNNKKRQYAQNLQTHCEQVTLKQQTVASPPMISSKNSPMPFTDNMVTQAVIMGFMLATGHKAPAFLILRSGLGNLLKHNQ